MPSLEQLTHQIIASPDDNELRLQFADMLSAVGDPRGEVIRLQCEIHGLSEQEHGWYWRRYRLANLLRGSNPFLIAFGEESVESRWTSELDAVKVDGKGVGKGTIDRGFIESFAVFDVPRMKARELDILAIAPLIRGLEFSELSTEQQFDTLASLESVAKSTHLKFSKCHFPAGSLDVLFESPQLRMLNRLTFSECSFAGGIERLGRTRVAKNIQELSVSLSGQQADEMTEGTSYLGSLLSGDSFPCLRSLEFDRCCSAYDLSSLTHWSGLPRLKSLDIGAHRLPQNTLEDFLRCDFPSLENLRLSRLNGRIDRISISAEHLRILSLKGLTLDADAMLSLSRSLPETLQHLTLSSSGLTTSALTPFLTGRAFANLRFLNLQLNQLDSTAVEQIVNTEWLKNLVTLKLSFNPLGTAAGDYLANSELIKTLAFLDLSETQTEDAGMQRLAAAPASNLQWLNVDSNDISSNSLAVLLNMRQMTNLVALRLKGNEVFDQHKQEFIDRYGKEVMDSYWLGYLV